MHFLKVIVVLLATTMGLSAHAETRLMMVQEDGCSWCARWNQDVGGEYSLTDEGKLAPLLRYDIHDPVPEGVTFTTAPHYTPTFILLVDGIEVNRIEGYPGEGFFWGLLGMMLANLPDSVGNLSES